VHYYSHNVADYRKDTAHLSLLEHGIYRQLLDSYYLDEKPIETQQVIRRLSIKTQEEELALKNVLDDFFTLSECGKYHHHVRCDSEIVKYKDKAETSRTNGSKGGRPKKPKKTQQVNLANPDETQTKGNHKPRTINQELKTIDQYSLDPVVLDHLFSQFWGAGMVKTGKKKTKPIFARILRSLKNGTQADFTSKITRDIRLRLSSNQLGFDSMHPATYLNGERWNDEIIKRKSINQEKIKPFENLTNKDWANEIIEGNAQ